MTVPWTGFAFKAFLDLVQPASRAKYVRFVTFHRPHEAPEQHPGGAYQWPYYEALTIEEMSNDLTLMANGIYGHEMPRQHGASLRIVVPWKYGYKSVKSVVRIELTEQRPPTFWNDAVPREYDFWSNVNPRNPTRAGHKPPNGSSAASSACPLCPTTVTQISYTIYIKERRTPPCDPSRSQEDQDVNLTHSQM